MVSPVSMEPLVQETKVLAIASHVVYGYVGNTMAAFVMQALGCDVAALNTVQFSNHTGYKQFKGTRTTAEEIADIYAGLKRSYLTDFDVLLSGYAPSAEAVEAVGAIARDLKLKASTRAGSFFWVLDPVMGDEGRLYVNENVVPVYKNLLHDANLILPNQFEAEYACFPLFLSPVAPLPFPSIVSPHSMTIKMTRSLTAVRLLSETTIDSLPSLQMAIATLHVKYRVPHIIITSIRFPHQPTTMSIIGSTATSTFIPRLFCIDVPAINCFFSGTGDMFAALTVVRLREAVCDSGLTGTKNWMSPDNVQSVDLPLAKAAEKVLGSMHAVLEKTMRARREELQALDETMRREHEAGSEKRIHLRETKAAEVRVTRCLEDLRYPKVEWKAVALGDEDGMESGLKT